MLLDINKIRIDCGTQVRSKIEDDRVLHYFELMSDGVVFPPVTVHFDGVEYYLTDGFHRYHAQNRLKRKQIEVREIKGTLRDGILFSKKANGTHGIPLSYTDRRQAAIDMLQDYEWDKWSDREIADHVNLSQPTVSKLRVEFGTVRDTIKYRDSKGVERERKRAVKPEKEKPVAEEKPVTLETPKEEVQYDNHDPKDEVIAELIRQNNDLEFQLAVGTAENPEFAKQLIQELRDENEQLKRELRAVTISRDTYQTENNQLRKQCTMYQKKLKAAGL